MVCGVEPAHASADQAEERGREACAVKEVEEVKGQQGEIVGGIDAGVHFPQEPFVVVQQPLPYRGVRGQILVPESWTKDVGACGMYIVALVQLPLDVWQCYHDGQVPPHVRVPQLQCFAHLVWGAEGCTGNFAILDPQDALSFQAVEVFGKAAAIGAEIVSLYEERQQRVQLIKRVEDP